MKFSSKQGIHIVFGLKNAVFATLCLLAEMPRLSKNDRERAIGMLLGGLSQTDVARRLGVHRTTIARLWNRFTTTGSTDDRPRPGQRQAMTPRQDRYIRLIHTRERFQFATISAHNIPGHHRVSAQTIRNRLRSVGLRAHSEDQR